jgi:hypothetical protein
MKSPKTVPRSCRHCVNGSACRPRNITVLVDGLEKEGLARRALHSTDRRATLIELTDKGRAAHSAVYATHSDRAYALFASQSPTDQRHLRRILARLAEALTETSAAEGKLLDLDPTTFRENRAAPTKTP